jgi:hypothetical protein
MPTPLQDVCRAALLFDIGRVRRLAGEGGDSSLDSTLRLLNELQLAEVADTIERWQALLERAADWAAGGSRPGEPEGGFPVVSPFMLRPGSSPQEASDRPPSCGLQPDQYRKAWSGLCGEIRALPRPLPVSRLIHALEVWTSEIPFAPGPAGSPWTDIPFFDQAKITAALACSTFLFLREHYPREDPAGLLQEVRKISGGSETLLLVGGDLSGVQEFVYRISSKAALKALRGRSFFLELFVQHIVTEILQPLDLSTAHQIFAEGGRFTLILANAERVHRVLAHARDRMNAYLLRVHAGKLFLALEWVRANAEGLGGGSGASELNRWQQDLLGKIEASKAKRFFPPEDSHVLRDERECSRCGSPLLEESRVPAEECSRWGLPPELALCPLCFLLEPKRLVEPAPDLPATNACRQECGWCHQLGTPLILPVASERLFGCDHELCLGTRKVGECQFCHRHAVLTPLPPAPMPPGSEPLTPAENILICPFCRAVHHVGEHLSQTQAIVRSPTLPQKVQRVYLEIDGLAGPVAYYFAGETPTAEQAKEQVELLRQDSRAALWVLNAEKLPERFQDAREMLCLRVGNYAWSDPRNPNRVPTMEDLARGNGATRIGALRMDVDDLGDAFKALSLRPGPPMARWSAASRWLRDFFKRDVNAICAGGATSRVQVLDSAGGPKGVILVYSGGDDLFLVGNWNDVTELAFEIHDEFSRRFGRSVTLSGGFVIAHEDYPLYQLARGAGRAVDEAKLIGKDALAPFFPARISGPRAALKWDGDGKTAKKLLVLAQRLYQGPRSSADSERIPRGLLQDLFDVVALAGDTKRPWFPRLAYALRGTRVSDELRPMLLAPGTVDFLHPALVWADLGLRRKEEA